MAKTSTLNLRIDPAVKEDAEAVLRRLGMPMSVAIDLYLRQIALTGGIPFQVTLPKALRSIDADRMTPEEISAKLQAGYDDMKEGRTQEASAAFKKLEKEHPALADSCDNEK
jgi:addiction module RelB/DinJ family antitoxin